MSAKKANVKNTMQIHSQAKVDFYKTYLERYLAVLCTSPYIKHINIYDVFCGMGVYEDGGKGSPIVAYDTIKNLFASLNFQNETNITLIVNDKSEKRISVVKDYIAKNRHPYCEVKPYNLDVDDLFNVIIPSVNNSTNDTRNLIFIDPYGYKNIKKDLLYDLMKNGKTEIILSSISEGSHLSLLWMTVRLSMIFRPDMTKIYLLMLRNCYRLSGKNCIFMMI